MSSVVPNMFQCNVCSKVYKYQKSYLEHVKIHAQPQYGAYPPSTFVQYPFVHYPMEWNNQQMERYYQYNVQNTLPLQYNPSAPYPSTYYPIYQYPQYSAPMMWQQNPHQQLENQERDLYVNNSEQQIQEESPNQLDKLTQYSNNEMDISTENDGDIVTEHIDEVVSNVPTYYVISSAFKNNIATYGIPNKKEDILIETFVKDNHSIFKNLIESDLCKHKIIKLNISFVCEYIKIMDDEMEFASIIHRAKMNLLTRGDDIDNMISNQFKEIENKMSEFQERDSGWTLIRIIRAEVNINKSSLVKGSNWISTPNKLAQRRACINIENDDMYCFKWSIIAAMDTTKINNFQRCSSYNINNIRSEIITLQNHAVIDFSSLLFPMNLKSINTFENNNSNISINVFGYDEENDEIVGPYYVTKEEKIKHINLLLLENSNGFHYILIKDISR